MTDPNYTHILTVVDRSGSMYSIQDDMRGALDEFFKSQAELDGKCLVDYVQFDDSYELVFEDKNVADAKAELEPRGMTALLDAIGKSVTDLGKKLAKKPEDERPGKVIVVVITDGMENSSRDWNRTTIKELIGRQEDKYQWEFTFLGANMDAVSVGATMGFKADKSLTYNTTKTGETSAVLSAAVTRTRSGLYSGYTDAERDSVV